MHDGDEMNHDDMDEAALEALRRALSDLRAPGPPPLEAIAAKARAHRRRRRSGLVAAGSGAAAVVITAAVLAASGGPSSNHLGSGPVHVNLADFSVESGADGTVRVDLRAKQAPDAPQLASVLAEAGVRAVVRVGAFCGATISPAELHQAIVNVVANGRSSVSPQVTSTRDGGAFWIRPSAIPKDAEVSIGYSPSQVTVGLVAVDRPLTCVVNTAVKCAAATTLPAAAATTLPAAAATTLPAAAATTLPAAAATTLPAAAATTLPAAAATTLPAAAATTLPPTGGASSRSITAAGPGVVATWCEVQALAPAARAATTTSTPAATTTTLAPSTTS